MKLNDVVYGSEEISEPVLIDLINSDSVQRLKNISQQGLPDKFCHKPTFSRYEHSIGVLIILRRLGAGLKEQIAGLIHDVSHTAFSHVTELLFGDPRKDDYQDSNHEWFVKNSDIPLILEKYGFHYKEFIELEKFSLLENEIPGLCADRFDYTIREIFLEDGKEKSDFILKELTNLNGKMVFSSYDTAKLFALGFLKCQVYHWGSDEGKIRYKIFSEILSYALKEKIIEKKDLWKDDKEVMNLLNASNDEEIISRFKLLGKDSVLDLEEYHQGLVKKFRYVDPLVFFRGEVFRLSDMSDDYRKLVELEKERSNKLNISQNSE